MKISVKNTVRAPLMDVYHLLRNDISSLVPHLPNVEKIVTEKREDMGPKFQVINRWYAKAEMPAAVKSLIKPEFLSWLDIADWDDQNHWVDYRLESSGAKGLFEVKGRNSLREKDEKNSELEISCELNIYPEKLPGFPKFLAGTVRGPVEDLVKRLLEPNLKSLADGLNKYFASL